MTKDNAFLPTTTTERNWFGSGGRKSIAGNALFAVYEYSEDLLPDRGSVDEERQYYVRQFKSC